MTDPSQSAIAVPMTAPPVYSKHGLQFAVVRLGADSEDVIKRIDSTGADAELPFEFSIKCKQVPKDLPLPVIAFVWLGTNNNKGGATPWIQGLRALGTITSVDGGPRYNDEKTVTVSLGAVLPRSLTKKDFVKATGDEYLKISDLPVIGINNYSSQVVQSINSAEESQRVDVLMRAIEDLAPGFAQTAELAYPQLGPLLQSSDDRLGRSEYRYPVETSGSTRLLEATPIGDPVFTELLARVRRLLKDGFGGVIFRGPPGTSKSWYARRIGAALVDRDPGRIRFVQFHPSYQYEDFVEGLVPDAGGTFQMKAKHFLEICEAATEDEGQRTHVLVVDEMSRADPARVFGEALTYLESSKRGEHFHTASGREVVVPPNLVVLATMNVWDRGIDEVDAALERRFAGIAFDPDKEGLLRLLSANGVEEELRDRVLRFFDALQHDPNPMVRIGHAYFQAVRDESSMHRLWHHQLRFLIERAFPLESDGFARVQRAWAKIFPNDSFDDGGSSDAIAHPVEPIKSGG